MVNLPTHNEKLITNSGELDMTVNILIQVDKLVQLIESPVFTCKSCPSPPIRYIRR